MTGGKNLKPFTFAREIGKFFLQKKEKNSSIFLIYFQVKVLDTVEVYMGWEWEARILERFCEYVVDGVPGWGVSEWHYRHHGGRPQHLQDQDPEKVKHLPKY